MSNRGKLFTAQNSRLQEFHITLDSRLEIVESVNAIAVRIRSHLDQVCTALKVKIAKSTEASQGMLVPIDRWQATEIGPSLESFHGTSITLIVD